MNKFVEQLQQLQEKKYHKWVDSFEDEETHESVYQEQREADCYMDIIPLVFMPHLHGWFKYGESEVIKASACTNLPGYALSDQAALIIDGDEVPKIIGDDYLIAEKGELIS